MTKAPQCENLQTVTVDGLAALERAAANCKERGQRWTALRALLLRALLESERPLSSRQLLQRLRDLSGREISAMTLYRCLDFLILQGFARKIAICNGYVALKHDPVTACVMFLLCGRCGAAKEVLNCDFARLLAKTADRLHFDVDEISIEVHGKCHSCWAYSEVRI